MQLSLAPDVAEKRAVRLSHAESLSAVVVPTLTDGVKFRIIDSNTSERLIEPYLKKALRHAFSLGSQDTAKARHTVSHAVACEHRTQGKSSFVASVNHSHITCRIAQGRNGPGGSIPAGVHPSAEPREDQLTRYWVAAIGLQASLL